MARMGHDLSRMPKLTRKRAEVEVIKEVRVEVPMPYEVIVERIVEMPVEVVREVVREVPVEVVREVQVEVPVEKIVYVDQIIESVREVVVHDIHAVLAEKAKTKSLEGKNRLLACATAALIVINLIVIGVMYG